MKRVTLFGLSLLFASQVAFSITSVSPSSKEMSTNKKRYLPDKMKVPFKLVKGLIFIKATLNAQEGYFMLDSGAPGLIVNINRVKGPYIKTENYMTGIVNAKQIIRLKYIKTFQWATYQLKKIEATVLDLSSIEAATGVPLLGFIGHKVIRNFEMVLDYKNQELILYRVNKKGIRILPYDGETPISTAPFKMKKHIPVIEAKVNNQLLKFGIDTGAQHNLLSKKLEQTLFNEFVTSQKVTLQSIDNKRVEHFAGKFKGIIIGQTRFENMMTVLSDMQPFNRMYHVKLAGLLGAEFLSSRKVSLNFRKKEIAFWERPEVKPISSIEEEEITTETPDAL